jgi:hypothetical protein
VNVLFGVQLNSRGVLHATTRDNASKRPKEVTGATHVSSQGALMMEAARTSETSVDNQLRTRQYIPEDSELQGTHVSKDIVTTMSLKILLQQTQHMLWAAYGVPFHYCAF